MVSLKDRLTEILIKNKLLTQEQLKQAIEEQKKKGGTLSEAIINLKFIREQDLMTVLSEGLNFPPIDLKRFKVDSEVVNIIPYEVARRYRILAISRIGEVLTLAMADPLNIFAIDHVASLTGYKINPIIANSQDIMAVIESVYPDTTKEIINDLMRQIDSSAIELVRQEISEEATTQTVSIDDAPAVKVTDWILEEAVNKKASDILIEPFEKKVRVRYRIDGILQEAQNPPRYMHDSIVSRIKVMSLLDIAEHRLPQDGRFKAKVSGKEVDFRVSILPSSFGEKVAIRILDKSQAMLDIDRLGFNEHLVEQLKKLVILPHGMILVSGPTGSGKTTTLYSLLKYVDSPQKNIVTVEDPVEYQLEGINQVAVRTEVGLTFGSALRAILRQDPNVIMIGEIRDFETVDIAIKSALTGHLVLSTVHTTSACGSIVRLINMGVEPFLIDAAVICVLGQRLVRRICQYCKEEQKVSMQILNSLKVKMPDGMKPTFYKGKGCQRCFNLGYSGRLSIGELLILTPAIRELILKRAQEHIIKQQARKEGMRTLREDGIRAALAGLTSLEEVVRITAADD
ncbi:MAG: ATPase, T2SS/T4P/T4SS family [Candidatus Omnitrophica bacterium]|nr:ATPase, T2SS/T4P/T4SS family [Candidatus Omnitrophota bacterium]